jgi:signal transduction histidine kinase
VAILESGNAPFQPYARLISVLGDQLISDKWIGLIELVKNCYDADAENVKVRFLHFDNPTSGMEPTIEIEDDGDGMDKNTVLSVWMKPATPNKLNKKKSKDEQKRYTKKGRVMQGDKGVGRFAIYKLGDHIELFTKTKREDEIKMVFNFSEYANDEFVETNHTDKFLDEIKNHWQINNPPEVINNSKKQGTLIRITKVRNYWKFDDLDKLYKTFFRMIPPVLPGIEIVKDFSIELKWDDTPYKSKFLTFEEMTGLAPYYFEGSVDENGLLDATFKVNNRKTIPLRFNLFDDEGAAADYDIRRLKFFKERFLKVVKSNDSKKTETVLDRKPDVGGFLFFFYGYNLKNASEGLKETEKAFLKETSVYLYRDNVRVYPYGEIGDDWLMISKQRAEDRAGSYFSYNDLIGFIFITQTDNPKLRDAADREGLMSINGAKEDFIAMIQAVLKVMKDRVDIEKKKKELEDAKIISSFGTQFDNAYAELEQKIKASDDSGLLSSAKKFFNATNQLVTKVRDDLRITQELAGTGMAVEKATHDTMSLLKRLKTNTESMVRKVEKNKISADELKEFLIELEENLEFLYQELQVLQPLFRVARKVTKDVSVINVTERVIKYFRKELEDRIDVRIEGKKDITVRTNTGLILQVMLNLMDNSIYWLSQRSSKSKQIIIKVDSEENRIIFADSGVGIEEEVKDLVFQEFYSRKSDGRGLGLYIVKELLERIEANISVITNPKLKILRGANFLIEFKK